MLKIGADPELFVRHNNIFISGHIFDCGSKEKPLKTKHGSVQVDGLALEFNVLPATDKIEFVQNIRNVMADLNHIVKAKGPAYDLVPQPTVWFGSHYLRSLPENTRELGCNHDFNAWEGGENPKPNCELPIRTGAGHVHLGWGEKLTSNPSHFLDCCGLTRELDYFLGLPSLSWDDDHQRRSLYGKAGAFRPKDYGLEYRVLSNAWLRDEDLMRFVFDQSKKAYMNWKSKNLMTKKYEDLARNIIDAGNSDWVRDYPDLAKEI